MQSRLRILGLVLVILLSGCQSFLQPAGPLVQPLFGEAELDLDAPLDIDPEIRYGVLDNGLTYYVKRNTEPMNRAELWLAVDAGSVLEDEDQLGLAHFLEHMMFNGTERFPEQALINFFESVGMTFGPDINAYTSFDETVYQLHFPTDDPEIVKTAFEVLEDWAAYATIDPAEVDAERGVIIEEERLRDRNASGRIREKLLPVLLADSRYAERLPIGDLEIIRTAPAETLRRFYETWYRPDLMAVIAVGDFDPAEFEALIVEHFSDLPVPENPVPRPSYTIPDHEGTRYLVVSDPEHPVTQVEVLYKQEAYEPQTPGGYRDLLIQLLFSYLFNFRLSEISREVDSPFINAYYEQSSLVRSVDTVSIGAQVQDEEILSGLEAVLTEVERIRRFGFTESELERAKESVLTSYWRMYNNRANRSSDSYADEYLRNFFTDETIPGMATEVDLAERLLPGIELSEVNEQVEALVDENNRFVTVTAPEKVDLPLPTETELATVMASVEAKTLEPYVDIEGGIALLAEVPAPARIVSEETISELGITEIELENGVRVIMKPTDFTQQVVFAGISPGGSSLVSEADYLEAAYVGELVAQSGLGDLSRNEIIRLLTGKGVVVVPSIEELTESISGAAPPDELDSLFQLIYLYFTAPHLDEAAANTFEGEMRAYLRNRDLTPSAALQDAIQRILYGGSVRFRTPTVDEIEALDLERALEIYQERFADADDFTFIFIGDFSVDALKVYAQRYLGSLPALAGEETWIDHTPERPDGVVEEAVYKGQEERGTVQILFSGPAETTPERALQLSALEGMLDILLREELRESRAGVYSSGVSAGLSGEPDNLYNAAVFFVTDPARVDELVDATFATITELQAEGPSPELLTTAKAQLLRNREEASENNFFWLSTLAEYALDEENDLRAILDFEEKVDALTAEELQAAAQEFLNPERFVQVVLYPEAMEPEK